MIKIIGQRPQSRFLLASYVLLFAYVIFLLVNCLLNFSFALYLICCPLLNLVLLIGLSIKCGYDYRKKKKSNDLIKTFLILAIPLLGLFIQKKIYDHRNTHKIFSAYSDGVIIGAEISFYNNEKFKYCNSSLLGEKCFLGTYKTAQDTFYLSYSKGQPSLSAQKIFKEKYALFFINDKGEIDYQFKLD